MRLYSKHGILAASMETAKKKALQIKLNEPYSTPKLKSPVNVKLICLHTISGGEIISSLH